MADKLCMHCFVSGKVQGVWFRDSAKSEAEKLGITGWVRNRSDGRMEVLAFSDKKNLEDFYFWLKRGPKLAKVTELVREDLPWQHVEAFVIKPTV